MSTIADTIGHAALLRDTGAATLFFRLDGRDYGSMMVVFVERGDVCRIISAWRTNAKEDRAYAEDDA